MTISALPGARLGIKLVFDANRIEPESANRVADHLIRILTEIIEKPNHCPAQLELLSQTERRQLLVDWNDTREAYPDTRSIHGLFEDWALAAPERIALVAADRTGPERFCGYGRLNAGADRLAHVLRAKGVAHETPVGVCLDRSPRAIMAMLAILKAGGAYVPLDPSFPANRLAFMLADTGASLLITDPEHADLFDGNALEIIEPDTVPLTGDAPRSLLSSPENLAYIMFTSGSTGAPKGVEIRHRGVVRLVRHARFTDRAPERMMQLAPLAFDASTFEVWAALLNGASLIIDPEPKPEPARLVRALHNHRVTTLHLTAGLFHLMIDERPDAFRLLERLLAGGDVLSPSHVAKALNLIEGGAFFNCYGPTENTVFSAWLPTTRIDAAQSVPIGRPVPNSRIYLLDRYLAPVPLGAPGQVYCAGDGLARGYCGRPDLTAEKFTPNPFEPGGRMYATGDLARMTPDPEQPDAVGSLAFLGRFDHQVKIRGFRIELGEIEAALAEHPRLREVVVLAEGDPGEKQLLACLVAEGGAPTGRQIRDWLAERTPDYMVPVGFCFFERFPLTPNGKLDRAALRQKSRAALERGGTARNEFATPHGPEEEALAAIWADVLTRRTETIGATDPFFEIGGHSLLATRVVNRISATFQIDLPLAVFFQTPTIRELAHELRRTRSSAIALPPITPVDRALPTPLSFAQERLWFLDRLEGPSATYNIVGALNLTGALRVQTLERTFDRILSRHEVLRTGVHDLDGAAHQRIQPHSTFSLFVSDLTALKKEIRSHQLKIIVDQFSGWVFELDRPPLFRAQLLRLNAHDHVLLVNMHHIVSDGWSAGILIEEIKRFYNDDNREHEPEPAPHRIQYADYAVWQRRELNTFLAEQARYWKEQLAGAPDLLELPLDRARPAIRTYNGSALSLELDHALTKGLKKRASATDVTLFMVLHAGFACLLARYGAGSDIPIGAPIANRNHAGVEDLIGFFVNTLVLRADLSGDPSLVELLDRIKQTDLGAYTHQDLPFEQLVELMRPVRDPGISPLFQVMILLQNAPLGRFELSGLQATPIPLTATVAKFDLSLNMTETERGLATVWEYNTDLFERATIERMAAHFARILEYFASRPELRVSEADPLDEAERNQLLRQWNDTREPYPSHDGVHQLFEEWAERTPERVAVVLADHDDGRTRSRTFACLNAAADRLAEQLAIMGAGRRVGLCLDRTPEAIVAMLAILKTGAAYTPLDPSFPDSRLDFILTDTGLTTVVTSQKYRARFAQKPVALILADEPDFVARVARRSRRAGTAPESLAYIMYTSGSTGTPKGVAITHRGVVRLVRHALLAADDEVFAQLAPLAFDASTFEIWAALLNGNRLIIYPETQPDPHRLSRFLRAQRVSTLHLTAGLFHLMAEHQPEVLGRMRRLLAGGDVLSPTHVRAIAQRLETGRLF